MLGFFLSRIDLDNFAFLFPTMEVWEEWVFKALLVDVWLTHCFSLRRSPCLESLCNSPNLLDGRVLSEAIASSMTLKEGPDLN